MPFFLFLRRPSITRDPCAGGRRKEGSRWKIPPHQPGAQTCTSFKDSSGWFSYSIGPLEKRRDSIAPSMRRQEWRPCFSYGNLLPYLFLLYHTHGNTYIRFWKNINQEKYHNIVSNQPCYSRTWIKNATRSEWLRIIRWMPNRLTFRSFFSPKRWMWVAGLFVCQWTNRVFICEAIKYETRKFQSQDS